MSRSLQPATGQQQADALKVLFGFCQSFGLGSPDPKAQLPFYRHALADLPPDLLQASVDRTTRAWRWGNRMPLPADLRREVEGELSKRRTALAKLEVARGRCKPSRNREAKPDPAKAQRVAAETKAAARSTRPVRAPGMTDADVKRAQDAWNREAQRVAAESREDAA